MKSLYTHLDKLIVVASEMQISLILISYKSKTIKIICIISKSTVLEDRVLENSIVLKQHLY